MFLETESVYTLDECRRAAWGVWFHTKKVWIFMTCIVLLIVLGIVLLANGRTDTGRLAVLLGIIYPPLIAVIMERQIRAGFNTNKSIQNTNVHFSFYDDYFEVLSKTGNSHIKYENLYKVIETKNHFYPM